MMPGSVAASLLFTLVFGAVAVSATLPVARPRPAGRMGTAFCMTMCAALIAMAWWAEPASVVWPQVAVFGGAALWLVFARPTRAGLHGAVMAAAMTWMLAAMPARGGMPGMAGATPSLVVRAVSGVVAGCCVAASIPWVTRAGPGSSARPR
jgi:hypothetical protein